MSSNIRASNTNSTVGDDRAPAKAWWSLAVLMLPVLLVSIDNTVLSFAIPQLTVALNPSSVQLLWIVDVYPLILAGLLVTMGTLGDRVGRRRLLLIGAAGFGLVSLLAAFSTDASHLIAARALLGVFGATLMPSTLSLLRNLFHNDGQRRLAIAIWASAFSAGSALGPIVGGFLLEHFWWGSIFLMNVPVLVILLVSAPFLLPESKNPNSGRLDLISVALSVMTMLPIVYGIKIGANDGPSLAAIGSLLGGLAVGIIFVRRQLRQSDPLLDVRLFKLPLFTASITANFLSIFALVGLTFFVSQYLQLVVGLEPLVAGMHLLPGAIVSVLMGLAAVLLARVAPLHVLIPAGMLLSAIGYCIAMQLTADTGAALIVVVFILVGAGAGLAETLTNDAILASVPAERAGAASGISETAYELGSAIGVAVLGSVLASTYRSSIAIPSGLTTNQAAHAKETLGGAITVADELPASVATGLLDSAQDAFSQGVDVASGIGASIMAVSAVIVAFLLWRGRERPTVSVDADTEVQV